LSCRILIEPGLEDKVLVQAAVRADAEKPVSVRVKAKGPGRTAAKTATWPEEAGKAGGGFSKKVRTADAMLNGNMF